MDKSLKRVSFASDRVEISDHLVTIRVPFNLTDKDDIKLKKYMFERTQVTSAVLLRRLGTTNDINFLDGDVDAKLFDLYANYLQTSRFRTTTETRLFKKKKVDITPQVARDGYTECMKSYLLGVTLQDQAFMDAALAALRAHLQTGQPFPSHQQQFIYSLAPSIVNRLYIPGASTGAGCTLALKAAAQFATKEAIGHVMASEHYPAAFRKALLDEVADLRKSVEHPLEFTGV